MAMPPFINHRRLEVESRSPEETRRLAVSLSPLLRPGDVVALGGDLGAGKTTFVQGLAAGLGVVEHVTSPTFIIMREYLSGRYPLIHMDVYRLDRMQEVVDLGYDEFLDPSYIVVVEWGDMVAPLLPKEHLGVELRYGAGETTRGLVLRPRGHGWEERMPAVRALMEELFSVDREDPLFLDIDGPPNPLDGPPNPPGREP
ncbi:MAG: tRNA (adenosine(37)-N6)-threonylcarbamoyltransferase complex ATPase subunit type 1 TsaE [Actinomycetota bacterium]